MEENSSGESTKISYNGSTGQAGGYQRRFMNVFSNLIGVRDLPSYVKTFSDIGIDFSLLGQKNRMTGSRKDMADDDEASVYNSMLLPDGQQIETDETPYFYKKYVDRVRFLKTFSTHPEIEFILQKICDEAIVCDENGYFCGLKLSETAIKDEKVRKSIQRNFKRIYNLLGFNDGTNAWEKMLEWIIEGYKAWEIIYDDVEKPTRITAIEEFPAHTIFPMTIRQAVEAEDGTKSERKIRIWKQFYIDKRTNTQTERTLQDNQVIVIRWSKIPGQNGRISYTERLLRSFNLMRTMENTKVGWHVMNSQFRLKMIIPVGTKTTAKAKQAIANITNRYKEDLLIDHDSGEVKINGQARINFGRNIVLPMRQGQIPEVEGIAYNGPDMQNMDSVKYFEKKLWRDSVLPYSAFDRENGSGNLILFNAEGIPQDILTFYKFINRARIEFEKCIRIPVYLQTLLDYPELKIDMEFKSKIGITYESNSLFEEAKKEEILNHKIEQLEKLAGLTELDGQTPIYSKKFLYTKKIGIMTDEEWEENKKMRDEEVKEALSRENGEFGDVIPGTEEKPAEQNAAADVTADTENPE